MKFNYHLLYKVFFFVLVSSSNTLAQDQINNKEIKRLYQKIKVSNPDVKEISIKAFKKNRSQYLLVDVREKNEYMISHIPGAIKKEDFLSGFKKYKDKKIVFYCTIGYRSAKFIKELRKKKGNKNLETYNLEGSILGWVDSKGEVVDQSLKPVKKVHVYGRKWKLLPNGYEAVINSFW